MLSSQTFRTTLSVTITSRPAHSSELSRMFAAAVINRQFCEMLLKNPYEALQNGYLGETFQLSMEERELLTSIRADSLADLAKQINRALRSRH
jgi:hypothetical protein